MHTRPGWLMSREDSWSPFPGPPTPGRTTTANGSESSLRARSHDRPRSRSRHCVVRLCHGAAGRVGAELPWRLLRRVYAQIGASEGVRPDQLGRVDLRAVARLLTED